MRELIRKTWFATTMFVVSIVGTSVVVPWLRLYEAWQGIAMIMLVTPPIWWWLIGRRNRPGPGRGAFAGAVCALLYISPFILYCLMEMNRPDEAGTGFLVVLGITLALITVPVAAAIGTIIVLLQRLWPEYAGRIPRNE